MRILFIAAVVARTLLPANAEEAGSGHYVPGTTATAIGLPPRKPGLVLEALAVGFKSKASAALPLSSGATAQIDARVDGMTVGALYTFEDRILGAFYTVGAFVPLVDAETTATVSTPVVRLSRTDRSSGLGDVVFLPALVSWKQGAAQLGFSLPVYAPTGSYDRDRIASIGKNYWTADPTLIAAYNGSANGLTAAFLAGITVNSENTATDYRSGSVLHMEASAQKYLPLEPGFVGLGVSAFWVQQITDDSGPGAKLGAFRSQSIGIGPVIDYAVPFKDRTALFEFRWLPEIVTDNRVEGDYFWLKGFLEF